MARSVQIQQPLSAHSRHSPPYSNYYQPECSLNCSPNCSKHDSPIGGTCRCKLYVRDMLNCPFRVISAFLTKLFKIADRNNTGELYPEEFVALLER